MCTATTSRAWRQTKHTTLDNFLPNEAIPYVKIFDSNNPQGESIFYFVYLQLLNIVYLWLLWLPRSS